MTIDTSQARDQADFSEMIPHGALSFGVIKIRPFNVDAGVIPTPSKSSDAHYLDCEITLQGGTWDKRKVWTRLGIAGSPAYVNMGMSAMKAIRETGVSASVQNPTLYSMDSYMDLDGLTVGVKIKIESSPGYNDKNEIAVFLSPVQDGVKKLWDRLVAGDCAPDPNAIIAKRNPKAGVAANDNQQQQVPRWAAGAAGAVGVSAPVAETRTQVMDASVIAAAVAAATPVDALAANTEMAAPASSPAAPTDVPHAAPSTHPTTVAPAPAAVTPPWVAAQGAPVQSPK